MDIKGYAVEVFSMEEFLFLVSGEGVPPGIYHLKDLPMELEILSPEQNKKLHDFVCCDCNGPLLPGPSGGLSQNCLCSKCKNEFNVGPISHRIPGPCSEERQREVYNLNHFAGAFEQGTVVYRDQLDKGFEGRSGDLIFLIQNCHSGAGVKVAYEKTTGCLLLKCRTCGRMIGTVAVAEREAK